MRSLTNEENHGSVSSSPTGMALAQELLIVRRVVALTEMDFVSAASVFCEMHRQQAFGVAVALYQREHPRR